MKRIICGGIVLAAAVLFTGCSGTKPQPNPPVSEKPVSDSSNNGMQYIKENETRYIQDRETLQIKDGEMFFVNGQLNCLNGGNIIIEKGGSLIVSGEIELSGELKVRRGGKLDVFKGARIGGYGSVSVSSFNDIECAGDFTAHITPPIPITDNGVTAVGGVLIVNKKYSVPKYYGSGLNVDAAAALNNMRADSGYEMPIVSGFRDYETQQSVFAAWSERDGEDIANTYSARPGHSEHQTGLAMDITSLLQSYGNTAEGKWIEENCYKYGFILRYPQGKEKITGNIYEPWHLRYLGKSTAKLVHDSGLTLEEFLGVQG